jgi:phosphatidylglycerophosphate synthase
LNSLPLFLTGLRAALAPVLLLLALFYPSGTAFGVCVVLAFLSDVFDGIIARRLGIATPGLRRLDSLADSLFYVAATLAVWILHGDAISSRWVPLTILVGLEVARYAFDWTKFRREASYHMWSSKLWGLCLFAGFFALLALGVDGVLVDIAIYVGIVADLEGLAISAVLRRWQSDVPSIVHAARLRASERV